MQQQAHAPATAVEALAHYAGPDLHDLCDAADAAIVDGGGFGWLAVPPRDVMVGYWKGVLLVPERELFVARLDGTICGSAQLVRPTRHNEAGAAVGTLTTFFIAPWARGHGLAPKLVQAVEARARALELRIMQLDVRETQKRAIEVYGQLGYRRWGTNPHYALVEGRWLAGHYYSKDLSDPDGAAA